MAGAAPGDVLFNGTGTKLAGTEVGALGYRQLHRRLQEVSVSPACRIENVHSGNGVWGVGPADSTGKPSVTY